MSGATEKITLSKGESSLDRLKRRMSDTSFEGIMWFLNALPKVLGYYVLGDKINSKFFDVFCYLDSTLIAKFNKVTLAPLYATDAC